MAAPKGYWKEYPTENEEPWFVDGEGIERRVIQTDLPRYLGSDVKLRPGVGPDNQPGYWYEAYRPLTTLMIQSLKADSARWLAERSESRHRRENEPEYHQSQTLKDSRRRVAPVPTASELPAPEPAPLPQRQEPPPLDRYLNPYEGHVNHQRYAEPPHQPPPRPPPDAAYGGYHYPPVSGGHRQHPHPHDGGESAQDPYRPRGYPSHYSTGAPDPSGPPPGFANPQPPPPPPPQQPPQPRPDYHYYQRGHYDTQQPYYTRPSND